eukprot:6933537-Pyramimonas_sp.AAC.1
MSSCRELSLTCVDCVRVWSKDMCSAALIRSRISVLKLGHLPEQRATRVASEKESRTYHRP